MNSIYPEHIEKQVAELHRRVGSDNVFIYGPAGSGKTYIAKSLVDVARRCGHSAEIWSDPRWPDGGFKEGDISGIGLMVLDEIDIAFSDIDLIRNILIIREENLLSTILIVSPTPGNVDQKDAWFDVIAGTGKWAILNTALPEAATP